jgi:hypothetical protein
METRKFGEPKTRKLDNPKFKEEEEALRKRFTEQVKLEESRFRQWEQRVPFPLHARELISSAYRRTRPSQQGFGSCAFVYQSTRERIGDYGWK